MSAPFNLPVERKREIAGILLLALTTLLFLALATDGFQGDSRRSISQLGSIPNALGKPGAQIAGFLYILLGQGSHVIYFMTCVWGMALLRHRPLDRFPTRAAGFLLLLGSVCGLVHVDFAQPGGGTFPGGAIGAFVATLTAPLFGQTGANVILVSLALVGILLATEFLLVRVAHNAISALSLVIRSLGEVNRRLNLALKERRNKPRAHDTESVIVETRRKRKAGKRPVFEVEEEKASVEADSSDLSRIRVVPPDAPVNQELPFDDVPDLKEPRLRGRGPEEAESDAPEPLVERKDEPPVAKARPKAGVKSIKGLLSRKTTMDESLPPDYKYPHKYKNPPLTLFEAAPRQVHVDLSESLRQMGLLLEETLQTFGIEARVTDVTRGPTITRFELEPSPGVKVSRFLALADDIALALKAHRVRVEAPIPGKGRVGVEVPNEESEAVVIRELLESKAFKRNTGRLILGLGKDITGAAVAVDLATMPHLLVAGATGAGKTVCVKTILASLLCSHSPDELQIMLIDPKMVELSIFNDIPHLITPVVIDPKKAATSLTWLINEMEERYRLFAHLRVRNIDVYNESVDNGEIQMADSDDDLKVVSVIRKLPYIVCIIDELADLMMMARAEVEDAIARLAQLARAVGIHLIIATQRPSVDVLTGVIKANFPSRLSFQVSSRVDSRCILDEIGAERLIGRGDMLYLPPGQSKPVRIQGAFVSDDEMNRLIAYLKTQAPPQYRDEIEKFGSKQEGVDELDVETDELFEDAVRVVTDTGQASISMVQRRLRVGYTRAARLIDMMELKGIVGPHLGSKAREILISSTRNEEEVA